MVHFGEFMKTWSLLSNSVTRQVSFNRSKIGGKCRNSKIQMRHFGWFSNTVQKFEFTTRIPSLSAPSFASTQPQNLIILANFGLKMASEDLWRIVRGGHLLFRNYEIVFTKWKKKKNIRSNEKSCIGVQSSVNRVEPKIVVKMKVYIRKLRKLWKFRCRFYFILGTFFYKNWGV